MSEHPTNCPARLREMTPADIDAIAALDQKLFGVDAWPREMFVGELKQGGTRRYLVAEVPDGVVLHNGEPVPGGIVGYAGLMCLPPIADIQTIGVLPQWEGRGIARAMMDALIAEAVRRGATEVMLEVSSTNPRAQQLYLRYGFIHIHTRKKYYRDGSDGQVMRLLLPAAPHDSKDPS